MAEATAYEEQRRRQVEANKRKLEELQLHHLSAAVREATAAAKPSSVCPVFLTDSYDGRRRAVSCVARCLLFCHSLGILYPNRLFLQAKKGKARVPRDGVAAGAEPLRRSGRLADLPEKPVYYHVSVNLCRSRPSFLSGFSLSNWHFCRSGSGSSSIMRGCRWTLPRGATPSLRLRSWCKIWAPASPSSSSP